jgi:hypothetical protein
MRSTTPQPRGSATNRPPPDITELADLALLAIQPRSASELRCATIDRKVREVVRGCKHIVPHQ